MCDRRGIVAVLLCGLALAALARAEDDTVASDKQALKDAKVETDAEGLLAFFKKRTLKEETRKKIEGFVAELGHDTWSIRAKAQQGLIDIGVLSRPMLVGALRSDDPEVVRRARYALSKIGQAGEEAAILPIAARRLAHLRPAGAAEALLGVLPCIEDADAADEVAHVLHEVALDKDKKPHQAVILALKDRYPIKRHAAAAALARAGGADNRAAARKLLGDADAGVRRRVALALLESKDKEAVPALIALLARAPSDDVYAAEDALATLAGEQAPPPAAGDGPQARARYAKAWADWWKENEAKVDLKKIDLATASRNLTLVVALDGVKGRLMGSVRELDAGGKERWKISDLRYPVHATMVRNDRVLICEYQGNRVTERDLKGNIKWEKGANNQVLSAQRLRNGHTFIVTRNQLQEVDRDGKEVRTIARPSHDVVAAHKDSNGEITLITYNTVFRLDAAGKQLSSYTIRYMNSSLGFRAHFLPRGGVIVPDYSYNKVREYDAKGKVVWEADANRPGAVAKLRNGNVLVTSRLAPGQIYEINYKTKEKVPGSERTVTGGTALMADKR